MSPQKRTALRSKLQKYIEEIRRLKEESAHAERQWRAIQADALGVLEEMSLDSFSYENDEGFRVKATKVQGSSLLLDEPQLKKALGAKVWNTVTRRVLDRTKLEDSVAEGRVDPVTIAECSSEKPSNPYIKVTAKKSLKEDEESVQDRPGRKRGTRIS